MKLIQMRAHGFRECAPNGYPDFSLASLIPHAAQPPLFHAPTTLLAHYLHVRMDRVH